MRRAVWIGGWCGAITLGIPILVWLATMLIWRPTFYLEPESLEFIIGLILIGVGIASLVGFIYGLFLGFIIQKWSVEPTPKEGYRQAAVLGIIVALPVSILILLIFGITMNDGVIIEAEYLLSTLGFITVATLYSMCTAILIRWRLNRPKKRAWVALITDKKHLNLPCDE